MKYVVFFLLVSFGFSCKKPEKYPDKVIDIHPTILLSHRGGAQYGPFQDNTLDAVKYGFSKLDGVEIDIQMSKDNTLWLFHDDKILYCKQKSLKRIPAYTDVELQEFISCKGNGFTLTKLEDVFSYYQSNNIKQPMSLDIKLLPSTGSFTPAYIKRFAKKLYELIIKYNMESHVVIESSRPEFHKHLKEFGLRSERYLVAFGDANKAFKSALRHDCSGISIRQRKGYISLTKDEVDFMHQKGLRIQIWTIDRLAEINKAIEIGVDYIQTNNLDLK